VWNHFEAEGRLSEELQSMDIHTWVSIPQAELARQSFFYMDDVSLQVIEESPVTVATPLDEYFVGETIPWTVQVVPAGGEVSVALRIGDRIIQEQKHKIESGTQRGTFESRGLECGVYTIQAAVGLSQGGTSGKRQIILAPNPWEQ